MDNVKQQVDDLHFSESKDYHSMKHPVDLVIPGFELYTATGYSYATFISEKEGRVVAWLGLNLIGFPSLDPFTGNIEVWNYIGLSVKADSLELLRDSVVLVDKVIAENEADRSTWVHISYKAPPSRRLVPVAACEPKRSWLARLFGA